MCYCQCDVENYTDQVLNFLLHDRQEHIHTESSALLFCSVHLCYGFTWLFLCSTRFDWQNQLLFSENSFSEELASYWLLTRYVTGFFRWKLAAFTEMAPHMVKSCRWVSNIKISFFFKRRDDSLTSEYPWNETNVTFTWLSSLYSPFKWPMMSLS